MMQRSPHAWVVIPVHNRRQTTLNCLRHLEATGVLGWARALVVDDGSRDGTGAAVRDEFPGVQLMAGDGSLWWTGAIALGMRRAIAERAEVIVWLNDDCCPEPGAIERVVDVALARSGICGAVSACGSGPDAEILYAGGDLVGTWPPRVCAVPGDLSRCQFLHGNLVAISRHAWERVGLPAARWVPHCWGDIEYTYRAFREGIPVLLEPGARAVNDVNTDSRSNSWLDSRLSAVDLVRGLFDPKAWWYLRAVGYFKLRHFGAPGALALAGLLGKLAAVSAIKVCLPPDAVVRIGARLARERRRPPYFIPST